MVIVLTLRDCAASAIVSSSAFSPMAIRRASGYPSVMLQVDLNYHALSHMFKLSDGHSLQPGDELEEASRIAGGSWWRTYRRIVQRPHPRTKSLSSKRWHPGGPAT